MNGLRKYSFTDEDFNLDRRKINAMAYTPVSLFQPVWTMLESDLKERNSKAMPVFNHFDKYLVRGYTNAADNVGQGGEDSENRFQHGCLPGTYRVFGVHC